VPPLGDHAYERDPVPPLAVTLAEPFAPPLQLTLVCDVVAVIAVGVPTVTVLVIEQVLASIIVQV
jgi:hypothetical protein